MNDKFDLGEQVSVQDLPTDAIDGSNFFGAESADEPFDMEEASEESEAKDEDTGIKSEKKNKKVGYTPNAEASPQLKKFRELFGLKRIDVRYCQITRKGLDNKPVTMTFGLRPMNHEDYQWVIDKAADIQRLNAEQLEVSATTSWAFCFKQAVVAMSVCTMDEGIRSIDNPGTPLWKVFGLIPDDPIYVSDPNYPHTIIRVATADAFLHELTGIFYDIVEDLHTAVGNLIDEEYKARNEDDIKEDDISSPLASTTSSE